MVLVAVSCKYLEFTRKASGNVSDIIYGDCNVLNDCFISVQQNKQKSIQTNVHVMYLFQSFFINTEKEFEVNAYNLLVFDLLLSFLLFAIQPEDELNELLLHCLTAGDC